MNGQGAISSLLTGFVMGTVRFVLEVTDKNAHYSSGAIRWLLDMNFLHYAIFMFVVCSAVMIAVSLATPAPDRARLAGLTFATVDEKMDATYVRDPSILEYKPAPETRGERMLNIAFSGLLLATVIGLWIYFA
jgi:SSS family solute:Na+ symporter